jgi:putative ABC transport system permease protein
MIKNYLKIAFRNMVKYKGYSAINILGLAIGIACCLVIVIFVLDELSYDRYHKNAHRIYRVTREFMDANGTTSLHLGHVAPPFGPLMEKEFPQVQQAVRFYMFGNPLLIFEEKQFVEDKFVFAEKNVFKIFSFPLIKGDADTALAEPGCIVITEKMAEKYFGQQDAFGKTMIFQPNPGMGIPDVPLKITGILKKIPTNSHFTFDFLCSFVTYEQVAGDREMQSWGSNNYATYLLLPKGIRGQDLEKLFPAFLDHNLPVYRGLKPHTWTRLNLQPLTKIHLHSHLDSEIEANGNIVFVYIFLAIAFLVLLIACINFMNLSTARSARRAREVGIRKVVGSGRKQLRFQFLGESLITVAISMVFSLVIVYLSLPTFNRFVGKELHINLFENPLILPGILATLIVVGLLAGSYPALYLSQIQPVKVLKGVAIQSGKSIFRNILVIFQFTVSIALIIGLGVIRSQLDYARNKPLGFKKEQVIVLPATRDMIKNLESIKYRLKQYPGILNVSAAKRVPSGRLLDSSGAKIYQDGKAMPVGFRIANLRVDHDFFTTFGIDIAAGRFFSKEISTDSQEAFIINEATVRQLGWQSAEEAIDKRIDYGSRKGRIVGVVRDFHFESIHQKIAPMIFYINPRSFSQISLRLTPQSISKTLAYLKDQWQIFRPGYPFDYYFIDENFDRQYQAEEKLGHILGIFSLLAIFIACLGLLGLASYTAERRTKEISIRKVLGAHLGGIIWLFGKEFGKWVIMANVIAWPLAYYLMSQWLDKFAYSTHLHLGLFLLSSGICLMIALLTVSYQAIKAAIAKPVDALKYE